MSNRSIQSRALEVLVQVRKLAQTPSLTWVEANNAIYGPGGPFVRLFPSAKDRVAFAKTKESRQVDQIIDSLPEPLAGPRRQVVGPAGTLAVAAEDEVTRKLVKLRAEGIDPRLPWLYDFQLDFRFR